MKQSLFLLLLIICFSAGCSEKGRKTIITGTITGVDAEEVRYSSPIDGTSYTYFYNTAPVDNEGKFTIEMDLDDPGFITFYIPDVTIKIGDETYNSVSLPVLPGKLITLEVMAGSSGPATWYVKGDDEEALNTYINQPPFSSYYSLPRQFRDLNPQEVMSRLTMMKQRELELYDSLKKKGTISSALYQLIIHDRDCFYAKATAYAFLSKRNRNAPEEELMDLWMELYRQYPPDSDEWLASPSWYDYANTYVSICAFTEEKPDDEFIQELYQKGKIHTFILEQAEKRLSGKRLEFYTACYLFEESMQKKYEAELITLFDTFITEYPKSKYTSFLEEGIANIRSFHEKVNNPAKESIRLMDDYEHVSSLAEAVAPFKGKKVYVDVWATWCGPCKREFEYKDKFHEWAVENGYELLYISIDRDQDHDRWLDMMKYYDLEGTHIRASKALDKDLRDIFDMEGTLSIPWYIELDENGNIVNRKARRPSDIVK